MGSRSSWIRRLPVLLMLLQILLWGVHESLAKDLCHVGDRDALLAFKKQLIDEGGTYADWDVTKDCCAAWSVRNLKFLLLPSLSSTVMG